MGSMGWKENEKQNTNMNEQTEFEGKLQAVRAADNLSSSKNNKIKTRTVE